MSRDYCSSSSEHRGACTSQRASPVRTCIAVRMRVWAAVFARGCGVLRIVLLDNKADGRDATGEPAGRAERAHRPRARAPGSRILRQVQALLPCPGVAPRLHHSCGGRLHACSTLNNTRLQNQRDVGRSARCAIAGRGGRGRRGLPGAGHNDHTRLCSRPLGAAARRQVGGAAAPPCPRQGACSATELAARGGAERAGAQPRVSVMAGT